MKIIKSTLTVLAVCFLLPGCSTIFSGGGGHEGVHMTSDPSKAHFVITDESGKVVKEGETPDTILLDPADGFFDGAKYTIDFTLADHKDFRVELDSTVDGWVFGNILIGGIIGIVVDGATGAVFNLDDKVHAQLVLDVAPANEGDVVDDADHTGEANSMDKESGEKVEANMENKQAGLAL